MGYALSDSLQNSYRERAANTTISRQDYLKRNKITNGVKNGKSARCTEAQASDAFLFFGFFAFAVSTVFSGLATRGGRSGLSRV